MTRQQKQKSPAMPGFLSSDATTVCGQGRKWHEAASKTRGKATVLLTALLLAWAMAGHAGEPAAATSPTQEDIERQMCEHTVCQRNLRVVLKQKDGKPYDRTFGVFPGIVQAMGITVVAGQTVYLEADVSGDRLVNLKTVDVVVHPDRTVTATLTQDKDGGMMLSLANPFSRPLKLDVGMMPLDTDGLYRTSSCPVIAGGDSYEMWPYPIFQLVLGNARLLAANAPFACTELLSAQKSPAQCRAPS